MAAKLEKTSTPGIFRRHAKGCDRRGRCACGYVIVWRHRGRQHTETHRTLAEAREAKGNRDAGERRPVVRVNFEDYFDKWIKSYAGRTARGFGERSRALYRRSVEQHALTRWGTWRLADVEPTDTRELFSALRDDGVSAAGLKGLRSALSALFATAVEDGLLRSNPIHGVRIPGGLGVDTEEEGAKALTRAELALLLAALPAEWRLFFEFLTHTGLRISEAIGLTWRHLDLGTRPHVLVREQCCQGERQRLKSRHARRDIPLSAGMAERLRARRRDSYRGGTAPVFASVAGTELSRPNVAGRVLKPAARAAGLTAVVEGKDEPVPWVSFHTFRHTCASLLFAEGKNVKQVQEWLGHADPGFTLRTYVHLLDEGLGGADFFDEVLRTRKSLGPCRVPDGWSRSQKSALVPASRPIR
jgi:integrase